MIDPGKIRILPGEEFNDLDTGKKLLEKFGTLIGKNHSPLAEVKQEAHQLALYRCHDEEDGETSQSTRAQVDQEDDQANDQLDWCGPTHVKEVGSEVDTRNVSGDVIDQFSIGMNMASPSGESESLIVDRGDKSCAQQDASTRGTVEKVTHSKRRQNLEEEETKCETDAILDWRGFLSSVVGEIRMLGEPNDGLVEK